MVENKFTPTAEEAPQLAQEAAGELGHGYMGTEHLLLGLMREDEGLAHTVLTEAGLTNDLLTEMIRKSAGTGLSGSNSAQSLSPRAKHVLEIAMEDAARGGYACIGTEHLLAGILREGNNMAVRILRSAGVDARQLYTALMEKLSAASRAQSGSGDAQTAGGVEENGKNNKTLAEFTRDLTADARMGKLDPVIGRDEEISASFGPCPAARRTTPASSASCTPLWAQAPPRALWTPPTFSSLPLAAARSRSSAQRP